MIPHENTKRTGRSLLSSMASLDRPIFHQPRQYLRASLHLPFYSLLWCNKRRSSSNAAIHARRHHSTEQIFVQWPPAEFPDLGKRSSQLCRLRLPPVLPCLLVGPIDLRAACLATTSTRCSGPNSPPQTSISEGNQGRIWRAAISGLPKPHFRRECAWPWKPATQSGQYDLQGWLCS